MWTAFARNEGENRHRNRPYDPRMRLQVLVYAYASGVTQQNAAHYLLSRV